MLLYAYDPQGRVMEWAWVPSLGVDLAIRLDGLSMLFAGLIAGVGALVQGYALAYMHGKPGRGLFHVYLSLFMLAMLGLVLADNLVALFVFWELTTLLSYLLIGFQHEQEGARAKALQAMLVTGAGGLCLLAGLILIGEMAGTYRLSAILADPSAVQAHPLFEASLVLVLLGAFTKSAQFPFHFWLPSAMAAPTPVSAYLHSATMVKAGIYLLARVAPIYADTELWFWSLALAGGFTALWAAMLALRETDLKLMLAQSTNVALGKLTFLLAFNTAYAVTAAVLFIMAHAFYKAALFMVIGNVDKATGTRDYHRLAGLRPVLAISFVAAALASLSKAGVPPMMGFLSKEYMYKATLELPWWATVVLLLANVCMVTLGLILVVRPFLGRADSDTAAARPVETHTLLWLPPLVLAGCSLLVPLAATGVLQPALIHPAVAAARPQAAPVDVSLWSGFNLPLLLTVITGALGVAAYLGWARLKTGLSATMGRLVTSNVAFSALLDATLRLAAWQTRVLQHGRLSGYVFLFAAVLAVLLVRALVGEPLPALWLARAPYLYEWGLAGLLITAAVTVIGAGSRLLAVAALGVVGFTTTLVFTVYGAPDLAKTQLLVETLVVIFIAILMLHMPDLSSVTAVRRPRRALNAAIAGVVGLVVAASLVAVTRPALDTSIPEFFAENSLPGGFGRNVVNVILVDFRAFDTLGEVVVVVVAGLAAAALLRRRRGSP
jgi:multicomponent Na+:H+ antiporter subunit A